MIYYIYHWSKHALLHWFHSEVEEQHRTHRSFTMSGQAPKGLDQLIHFQTLNWYWPISSGLARSVQTHTQVNYPTSLYHSADQWLNPSAWVFGILTISPVTNTELRTVGVYCSLPCHEFAFQMAVKYLWALLMCFTARSCLVFCCCN